MQVVAILAQDDFHLSQVDGRIFQNWQVRICFFQFLEVVRSISRVYVGMTIGHDIFIDFSDLQS